MDMSSYPKWLHEAADIARRRGEHGAANTCEEAASHIEKLEARVSELTKERDEYHNQLAVEQYECGELKAALAEAQRDAKRYRYLIDHHSVHYGMTWEQPAEWHIAWDYQQMQPGEQHNTFDSLIDADIAYRERQEQSEVVDQAMSDVSKGGT